MNDLQRHNCMSPAMSQMMDPVMNQMINQSSINTVLATRARPSLHRCASALLVFAAALLLLVLPSCGSQDDAQSLEIFRQKWFAAVNDQQGESLYTMLDAASKRWVSRELDELRGLDQDTQRRVVDQLGGQRADNLLEFKPGQYFGLLWRQATEGRRPTMQVEASSAQTAYIVLSLNDAAPQRIRLVIEGGHWVWQLPEADFSVRARQSNATKATNTP